MTARWQVREYGVTAFSSEAPGELLRRANGLYLLKDKFNPYCYPHDLNQGLFLASACACNDRVPEVPYSKYSKPS